MPTYHFVAASKHFMTVVEPVHEILTERQRNYQAQGKPIDFWWVDQPQFLLEPQFAQLACPRPAVAVVSTDPLFIRWLKNRLAYVVTSSLVSPEIPC
ncbi:MgPME-cyclase complex family protein [Candidatus Cyanaurora vandensis]|uniref:MgPME-cyclase complex family protein n=1 Tax=Candidatus Cyanaurora vandensis TaxID=2714958 RepID=UPI00257A8EEA|nr:MgPME-cyclase complex family protein [Candidatus Cyanaurora vandensis]